MNPNHCITIASPLHRQFLLQYHHDTRRAFTEFAHGDGRKVVISGGMRPLFVPTESFGGQKMKITTRTALTTLVTLALVAGPLALATADSESNKGRVQRMMVGVNKACQVGELKANDKGENKGGRGEKKGEKSGLTSQAQKIIEQLTKKNSTASIAAAGTLRTLAATYITNSAAVAKTYLDAVSVAELTCTNSIYAPSGFKNTYETAVIAAKAALKTAEIAATTKEAEKAAQGSYQTAVNSAAGTFKAAIQLALTRYQTAILAAQSTQKTALNTLNMAFTAAIQTASAALA